ncbi:hypothetical protein V502_04452 [Pseudogymnoascus sp. VKM F-4520 (FW-2644)]|nr:hypothetical protein V502_04452 [Pseudogymnoascus sp. VKM F-4520 (FW-2644)]
MTQKPDRHGAHHRNETLSDGGRSRLHSPSADPSRGCGEVPAVRSPPPPSPSSPCVPLREADKAALNLKVTTAENKIREKSAAWKRTEESLRADLSSASKKSSSQEATIADLEKRLEEMTIEKDALAASNETSIAKSGFLSTLNRKLKERISTTEQDKRDLASMVEIERIENDDLTRMHIIASGAAGAAYDRLRDRLDSSNMAQIVIKELRVAAGVVAARAAQAKLHGRDTLLVETQARLYTITRDRDELTEKLTAASADFGHQRDQASSEEALNVIEKTRRALQKEEENSQALQKEIDQVGRETQTRAQEEQRFQQRQGELTKREEKLCFDTDKFDRYLAAESSRISREIAQINARVKERGEKFEQDEATARGKVQTLYDKVCADEEAVGRAKLELAYNVLKDSARLTAREATNQRRHQKL